MKSTYTVIARRSGGWWALEAPEIQGARSQVRRLDQAEAMIRDAIATLLDVPEDSFGVRVEPELADEAHAVLAAVNEAKNRLAQAQQAAALASRYAAEVLTRDEELSMRDAGAIMHVSHQRVAQLLGR
jgi:hypothetical protein